MNKSYEQIIKDYKSYLKLKNFKPRGFENKIRYAVYFLNYLEENGFDLSSFTRLDAESYREYIVTMSCKDGSIRFKPETVNIAISELRFLFKYLIGTGLVFKNVFLEVEKMKEGFKLPKNILTIEEMGLLLAGIKVTTKEDLKFKAVFEVLYSTGARITEVEALERSDIDLEAGFITIRNDKNHQDRIAPLTEYSVLLLKVYFKYFDDFKHGMQRSLNRFMNDRLKRLTLKLNLPLLTSHGIRHSIATHLLKKGADIREVQEFLGHKRIKNTEIYTRLMNEDLKKVVDDLHPRERNDDEK